MNRPTLLCLLFLLLFSVGYRTGVNQDEISKIYLVNNTLIRTTPGTDIRFYDLTNPAVPQQRGTIAIKNNNDVAVMGNYMYADDGYNLIVFDISDLGNPRAVDTIKGAFTTLAMRWETIDFGMGGPRQMGGASGCNACGSDEMVSSPSSGSLRMSSTGSTGGSAVPTGSSSNSSDVGGGSGKAGSMARFVIAGDYLYCIDSYALRVFEIQDPARPRYKNAVNVGWQIETLFPYGENLFIGGREGMYIYSIGDPDDPAPMGEFQHPRRCDPVVVEGNYAYVTLRGNGPCGGADNEMDILDISDLRAPKLVKRVILSGPFGLTVRDGIVLVCDGSEGVRVFDARDPNNPTQIGAVTGMTAHDIILSDRLMIVTAETGFFVYDARDLNNIKPFGRLQF